MKRLIAPLLAVGLLLTACTNSSPAPQEKGALPQVQGVTVEGESGEEPVLTFDGEPQDTLARTLLQEGDGAKIEDDDYVAVDYLGQVFDGDVFDSSFSIGEPFGYVQGANTVISGWEEALDGVKVGSRVLVSVPPEDGYGAEGNTSAGFEEDATLVFVIDVVATVNKDEGGQTDAVAENEPFPGISLEGALGEEVTMTVDPESALPAEDQLIVLARGSGEPIKTGGVVGQYVTSTWDGSGVESTWGQGPTVLPVGSTGSVIDSLEGVPVGSRVMMVFAPLTESDPSSALAVVFDAVEQVSEVEVEGPTPSPTS